MAEMSVNVNWQWFAKYKGIDIYELIVNGKAGQGVYAIALGMMVIPSDSVDHLRGEVDAWWKIRRN